MGLGGKNIKGHGPIGIAVTARAVYLAQHGAGGGAIFATQSLAKGVDPGEPSYHAETSSAIASALRQAKFVGRDSVSALPVESLIYKTLRMPPMPEQDLVQAIAWEASERFQFSDDQVLEHYSAGQVQQGSEKREEIILLAGEKITVHDHATAMKRAGMVPIAIDATGAALARLLGEQGRSALIVHLGQSTAEIVGTRDSSVIFDKPITLTRENGAVDSATLSREIGLCLRYLSVTFGIHKPDAAWVSGQGADEALAKQLTQTLHTSCRLAHQSPALQGVDCPGNDFANWLIPLGLAARIETGSAHRGAA